MKYLLMDSKCTVLHTVMDKCIHTSVKRHYINILLEMAVYRSKRVATIINFLTLFFIDIKRFSFNLSKKIFTGFEISNLESYTSTFFHYFVTRNVKKRDTSTFKFCHFKASKDFSSKIKWEPLDTNTNEMKHRNLMIVPTILLW